MRRGLASLIMGLSLIVATVSWAGFTLSRTLLDPGRSERLADQLLENDQVRNALIDRLADALEAQIPAEVPVPRQLVETGAEVALDDPRVEALIRDGFVRVHQNALAGSSEPVRVDAGALGAAGRDALVGVRPELDLILPPAPALGIELPTAGLSWLGSVKNFVDRWTVIGAVVSAAGLLLAFAVARDRAPVLRRVAFWAFGVAAFWLLMGYGLPWLIGLVSPTSAALATAMVDVFFGAMIGPAVTMAATGGALLAASLLWPMFNDRRGAAVLHPRTTRPGGQQTPLGPRPASHQPTLHQPTLHQPTGHPPTLHPSAGHSPTLHQPTGHPPTLHPPTGHPPATVPHPPRPADPTELMPRPRVPDTPTTADGPIGPMTGQARPLHEPGGTTVWEPGRGYVTERDDESATAEWFDDRGHRGHHQ